MKRASLLGLCLVLACPAWALEFRSTARAAILYDAPSQKAGKLAVASGGVPFEVLAESDGWSRVRDAGGRLAWLENAALGSAHTVLVTVNEAVVRQQPQALADPVFRAARGVVLDVDSVAGNGWVKVRHADGMTGWLRLADVWGK